MSLLALASASRLITALAALIAGHLAEGVQMHQRL